MIRKHRQSKPAVRRMTTIVVVMLVAIAALWRMGLIGAEVFAAPKVGAPASHKAAELNHQGQSLLGDAGTPTPMPGKQILTMFIIIDATATPIATATDTPGPRPTALGQPTPESTETPPSAPTGTPVGGTPGATQNATSTATPTSSTPTATVPPGSTATSTNTPTPTATFTATPDLCMNLLRDTSFESSPSGWAQYSEQNYDLVCRLDSNGDPTCGETPTARTGTKYAWLGGGDDETSIISQQVTIPSGSNPRLAFWYQIGSEDATCGNDTATINVTTSSGTTSFAGPSLCTGNQVGVWTQHVANLSAFTGGTVTVDITVATDLAFTSSMFVDDVGLYRLPTCIDTNAGEVAPANAPYPPARR